MELRRNNGSASHDRAITLLRYYGYSTVSKRALRLDLGHRDTISRVNQRNKMKDHASSDMAQRTLNFPDRKISETFLDFAAPLMSDLPSDALEQKVREVLKVCFTVWNAVIFADVLQSHRFLDEIRGLTAAQAGTAFLIEQLIARKRSLFAQDERMIGNWVLTRTSDGIHLHAEACDPYSTPLAQGESLCGPNEFGT